MFFWFFFNFFYKEEKEEFSLMPKTTTRCHTKGSFNNHVDLVLLFLYHPPTPRLLDTFYVLNVDEKGNFLTTYKPLPVHVVIERPLTCKICFVDFLQLS